MIYLDNAATTYPKPRGVQEAAAAAKYGANPGRGGYPMAMAAAAMVYECRKKAAAFFDAGAPENVVFTPGCTASINMVLKGLLNSGDHVVISDLEHNAVLRPLEGLKTSGVAYATSHVTPGDHNATVDAFRRSMRPNTRLVFCTHASNVFGVRLPIERLAALAHAYGAYFGVDAAQTAGVLPLHLQADGLDFICAAGHKGLYGPMGTGLLITSRGKELRPFCEGGTGNLSRQAEQPEDLPERFESGTQNIPGIAGLSRGLDFVLRQTPEKLHAHEIGLLRYLHGKLQAIPGVRLYLPLPDPRHFAPVLSFNMGSLPSEAVGEQLARSGIALRCGLHCAPMAHSAFGTLENGTVRVAPSAFSTKNDMDALVHGVQMLAKQKNK